MSDRPDATGKSTISESKNKNVASSGHSEQQQSSQQLPQTRKERAVAAEAAALKWVRIVNNTAEQMLLTSIVFWMLFC